MTDPIQASRPHRSSATQTAAPPPALTREEAQQIADDIGQAALDQAINGVQERRIARGRRRGIGGVRRPAPRTVVPTPTQPGEVGVYVRSFHPAESFDGGFDGDNRGFQTEGGSARISGGVVLNEDLEVAADGANSSPSSYRGLGRRQGTPRLESRTTRDGDTVTLHIDYRGNTPLMPSPEVDVHAEFRLTERSPTELHIHAHVEGDAFPAAETFLRDPSGQAVFIGVHAMREGQHAHELIGDGDIGMIDTEMTIVRDEETGNFEAVVYKGNRHTIAEWNSRFESMPAMLPDD